MKKHDKPPHDPRFFRIHASGAYGKGWQWRMALARGLNLRTVANWAAGWTAPPPELIAHLVGVHNRITELGAREEIDLLVDNLISNGANPHAVAALLEEKANKLSPRGTPAGVVKTMSPKKPKAG
jgi:hypothetical protein